MHIRQIQVKNFRALDDIDTEFDSRVNVIIGPNAVGKTTVLEAIRLTKALLSPRTQNESSQALIALSASSPHIPQSLNIEALARDPLKQATIRITYQFSELEFKWLNENTSSIAKTIVQAQRGQAFSNPAALLTYLGSPQGAMEVSQVIDDLKRVLAAILENSRRAVVKLSIDAKTGLSAAEGPMIAALIAAIDQSLPPRKTIFSYFSADRSLPQGEQPIQLGGADAQQQLESHNSQPQLKYARLKSTIFNDILMSDQTIRDEFEKIFSGILKGRRLKEFGINSVGLVSIRVEDIENSKTFEIDAMSSGEKG